MKRLLLYFLLGITLTGCGVIGSDGDASPEWVGDWKVTQSFDGDPPDSETYLSYSKERVTTFRSDPEGGCNIYSYEVVEIDGNDVTLDISGELLTERLTVSNGELTATTIRYNSGDADDLEPREATSVEANPRDLLGCAGSEVTAGSAKTWAPALKQDR